LKTLNLISIKNCPKNKLKKEIVIVWFKRDLRFTDHEALFYAQKQSLPILLILSQVLFLHIRIIILMATMTNLKKMKITTLPAKDLAPLYILTMVRR
jgi:hypothetical protein